MFEITHVSSSIALFYNHIINVTNMNEVSLTINTDLPESYAGITVIEVKEHHSVSGLPIDFR